MKNSFFLLFSAFAHLLSFANSNDIEKVNVIPTKIGTKTEATIPDVEFGPSKEVLFISLKSNSQYLLSITDEDDVNECTFPINHNGARTSYSIQFLEKGTYNIFITSVENEYSGELEIK